MIAPGPGLANAARALLGTPFRLGGRDTQTGVDCVGLIAAALEAIGKSVGSLPRYSLRHYDLRLFEQIAERAGLQPGVAEPAKGDVLLLRPSSSQVHLAISLGNDGIIQAHAQLRRVVLTPAPTPWPIMRHWRLA